MNGQLDPNYGGASPYGGYDSTSPYGPSYDGSSGGGDTGDPGNIDWGDGSSDGGGGGSDNTAELADVDNQIMQMLSQQAQQGQDASAPGDDSAEASLDAADQQDMTAGDDGVVTIPTVGANYTDANYTDAKTVLAVQVALYKKGYDLGDTGPNGDGVDGVFGSKTKAAIKKMQADAGLQQTGKIDEGVIMALGVTPGVLPPGVTMQGRAAVQAQAALDAATLAEHAQTPADAQSAATQLQDVANAAAPPLPPDVQQKVTAVVTQAKAAKTPAEAKQAAAAIAAVAPDVHQHVAPSWWQLPVWAGAPVKRWQGAAGLGGGLAVGVALAFIMRHH